MIVMPLTEASMKNAKRGRRKRRRKRTRRKRRRKKMIVMPLTEASMKNAKRGRRKRRRKRTGRKRSLCCSEASVMSDAKGLGTTAQDLRPSSRGPEGGQGEGEGWGVYAVKTERVCRLVIPGAGMCWPLRSSYTRMGALVVHWG